MEKITDNVYLIKSGVKIVKFSLITNCYLIEDLLIDTGAGKLPPNIKIKKVINTHHHWDHVKNNNKFPEAKIYMYEKTAQYFEKKRLFDYPKVLIPKFKIYKKLKEGDKINSLEIISTPGHCSDCICLYDKKNKILFSGDSFFSSSILPRTDLPDSSFKDLVNSFKKLSKLNIKIICPGHGAIIYNGNEEIKDALNWIKHNNDP